MENVDRFIPAGARTLACTQRPDDTRYQALISDSLGMPVSNQGTDDEQFGHGGSNRGFKCTFKGFPKKKAGYAIMTNGDQGGDLQGEIAAAIVRTYGWE